MKVPRRTIEELIHFSVINVNKPSGPLSKDVDQKIRELFKAQKAGHAGTLDPKVGGVLVVALDEATKILKFLMKSDKEYEGIMYLHEDIGKEKIEKVIQKNFLGEITQIPPVKSRVARKPRRREVYSFDILEKNGKDVSFKTQVEAGTYIRKLVHNLGKELGTGAHMKYLKRTKTGKFTIKNSYEIEEIEKAYKQWEMGKDEDLRKILIPVEESLDIKRVVIKDSSLSKIRNGGPINPGDIIKIDKVNPGEDVGIFSKKRKIIALGIAKSKNRVKTDRVFISKIPSNK